jgi:hypothetical protein
VATGGSTHVPPAKAGEERTLARRATLEPTSQGAAQDELMMLKAEILDIQGQLARRKAEDGSGSGSGFEDYQQYVHWKGHAVAALRAKEARHAFLKRWLTINRTEKEYRNRQANDAGQRSERSASFKTLMADVVTVLEDGMDAEPALARLIAWRDTRVTESAAMGHDELT